MRSIYTVLGIILLGTSFAFAQSGQYKRAESESQKKSSKSSSKKSSDGKVDIKELEEQYWTPKDTEFKVVQNRKYTKDGKLAFSLQLGIQGNDPYTESFGSPSAIFSYYFTEFTGVEFIYTSYATDTSEIVDRFADFAGGQGVTPEFAVVDNYIGVNYNWIPIYGKMSILDDSIIYFDLAISPGLGMTTYQPQTKNSIPQPDEEQAVTLSLDISQHYFFHEHWAIRVDMKNRAYSENRFDFLDGSSKGESDRVITYWQIGLTYYFDNYFGGKNEKVNKDKKN